MEEKDEDVTQVSDVDAGKIDVFKSKNINLEDEKDILNQLFMLEDYKE